MWVKKKHRSIETSDCWKCQELPCLETSRERKSWQKTIVYSSSAHAMLNWVLNDALYSTTRTAPTQLMILNIPWPGCEPRIFWLFFLAYTQLNYKVSLPIWALRTEEISQDSNPWTVKMNSFSTDAPDNSATAPKRSSKEGTFVADRISLLRNSRSPNN